MSKESASLAAKSPSDGKSQRTTPLWQFWTDCIVKALGTAVTFQGWRTECAVMISGKFRIGGSPKQSMRLPPMARAVLHSHWRELLLKAKRKQSQRYRSYGDHPFATASEINQAPGTAKITMSQLPRKGTHRPVAATKMAISAEPPGRLHEAKTSAVMAAAAITDWTSQARLIGPPSNRMAA